MIASSLIFCPRNFRIYTVKRLYSLAKLDIANCDIQFSPTVSQVAYHSRLPPTASFGGQLKWRPFPGTIDRIMPTSKPTKKDHAWIEIDGERQRRAVISKKAYASFNSSLLGLGDLSRKAEKADAIAAVFDLQGFTNFGKQIEPHLVVPKFLYEYLTWLFEELKKATTDKTTPRGIHLWAPLPFLVKFMGDGLLVLWDASNMSDSNRRSVAVITRNICRRYQSEFLRSIAEKVTNPPSLLRCGLARGDVYSVGNGNDYVGSCINMAARLQKLPGISFALNCKGFGIEDSAAPFFRKDIVVKKVSIRGIGDNELVGILAKEFEKLSPSDRELYRLAHG